MVFVRPSRSVPLGVDQFTTLLLEDRKYRHSSEEDTALLKKET